jgi:biotin-dependent carboxylase-like uncharacterized protein
LKSLQILDAGPLATIQDLGRRGYRDRGVPLSGAMDQHALQIANGLVANPPGAAGIEITLGGFRARFMNGAAFAVAGHDTDTTLNHQLIPLWTCCEAAEGDILSVESTGRGLRSYLAISGGIDVPLVMGSRSTYVRGGFGGFQGRALARGDILPMAESVIHPMPNRRAPARLIPTLQDTSILRVIPGPQDDRFTSEGIAAFLNSNYVVTDRCDRMGLLLDGPRIAHRHGADILSDGTLPGSVQVVGDGRPALLCADCQTTGGYTKIATVIRTDLSVVAHLMPGSSVRFQEITLLEARQIYLEREYRLRSFWEQSSRSD